MRKDEENRHEMLEFSAVTANGGTQRVLLFPILVFRRYDVEKIAREIILN